MQHNHNTIGTSPKPRRNRRAAALQCAAVLFAGLLLAPAALSAADGTYDSGGGGTADSCLKDAFFAAHHGRITEAIADDNRSLAISPNFAGAYLRRANDYRRAGLYAQAAADLDRVDAMHPNAILVAMARADLALYRGDGAAALVQLKIATKLPMEWFWHAPFESSPYEEGNGMHLVANQHMISHIYADTSIATQLQHMDDASIVAMSNMMKIETEYPEYILARYCALAAGAGLLESAELTCQQSIEANSHDIGQYDSLGFTHLRMKAWDKAIADYNKALYYRSDLTFSLYGRGIAKRARGDIAGGNADIAAATRGEPDIANIMKRLGAPTG